MRTLFSLIFANSVTREFKVLANVANVIYLDSFYIKQILAREFKSS